jgi:nucleoside-diphosphate-sugar epimerase
VSEIGILGATSLVGESLLRLMSQSKHRVTAFSRKTLRRDDLNIQWRQLDSILLSENDETISNWICLAPIWVLPDYFELLEAYGVRRVVSLSSTSRFTKDDSSDVAERTDANRLADGEDKLQSWAESKGIDWIILRPTMIYGLGKDKNIGEIARFISRRKFFPLLADGKGLRQPFHVEDVAKACYEALTTYSVKNRSYNLSGKEILSYKEMVNRIFSAMEIMPHFIPLPRWTFHLVLLGLHLLPRFRYWSIAMVDRMSQDMVFDHNNAAEDFGFSPRPFTLSAKDLPECCRK